MKQPHTSKDNTKKEVPCAKSDTECNLNPYKGMKITVND
jgi:hypothetical protein